MLPQEIAGRECVLFAARVEPPVVIGAFEGSATWSTTSTAAASA